MNFADENASERVVKICGCVGMQTMPLARCGQRLASRICHPVSSAIYTDHGFENAIANGWFTLRTREFWTERGHYHQHQYRDMRIPFGLPPSTAVNPSLFENGTSAKVTPATSTNNPTASE